MRAYCRVRSLLSSNTDGTFGFYLKRVGGEVLVDHEALSSVYPASTIKMLEHVHAMRAFDQGESDSLGITVYNGNDRCRDQPDGNSTTMDIRTALRRMMKVSDNLTANAIQDYFGDGDSSIGRQAMNETARDVIGMSSRTRLNHKFSCGMRSNDPANSMCLADMCLLYEQLAAGTLLSDARRQDAYGLMLNESDLRFIDSVIDSEAPPGLDVAAFKGGVKMAYKAGSISDHVSIAGWLQLPTVTGPEDFVYGAFVDGFTWLSSTLNIRRVIREMVRDRVCLAMWSLV